MSVESISGLGSLNSLLQTNQATGTNPTSAVAADSDGDNDGSRAGSTDTRNGGQFISAINQTLAQLGIGAASSSTGSATPASGSAQNVQQALQTFIHDLIAGLQAQGSATPAAAATAHHNSGIGAIEGRLQNLIQQLSASTSATPGGASSNSALATLQQDFSSLLDAQGAGANQTSLLNFLQTLAQNLQGAAPTGNVISTQA